MNYPSRHLILCVASLSLVAPPSLAQPEKPEPTVISGKRGSHRYHLRFVVGPFRKTSHKIRVSRGQTWLDGVPEFDKNKNWNWHRTHGWLPYSEFYSFRVTVDRRKWTVLSRL